MMYETIASAGKYFIAVCYLWWR